MTNLRRFAWAVAACLALASAAATGQSAKDDKSARSDDTARPKVQLKASRIISVAPARIVLTAELVGGDNDYKEFYCPTVEWAWGDGTVSDSTSDCEPYQAGKSSIKRVFTVEHVFLAGNWRVLFRLKRNDKTLAAANTAVHVRPGLPDIGGSWNKASGTRRGRFADYGTAAKVSSRHVARPSANRRMSIGSIMPTMRYT